MGCPLTLIVFVGYMVQGGYALYVNDNNRFPRTASGIFKRSTDWSKAEAATARGARPTAPQAV
jgi:hypothetical protein